MKAALSAMTIKTDRKDTRGIAQLLRWFQPAHAKLPPVQEIRALLAAAQFGERNFGLRARLPLSLEHADALQPLGIAAPGLRQK